MWVNNIRFKNFLNYFLQDRSYPDVEWMKKQQNNYLTDKMARGGSRRRAIV